MAAIGAIFAGNLIQEALLADVELDILTMAGLETAISESFTNTPYRKRGWTMDEEEPDYSRLPPAALQDQGPIGETVEHETVTVTFEPVGYVLPDEVEISPLVTDPTPTQTNAPTTTPPLDTDQKEDSSTILLLVIFGAAIYFFS